MLCVGLCADAMAYAQSNDAGPIAEALFRAGRELMAAGDYTHACPKLGASQRIDPKPGTLLNLALCHEKSGRAASAWAEYTEAASLAQRAGEVERESVARERARALEPTLVHIIVDAQPSPAEQVSLDDQPIGTGALGTPIPIDPGDHVLRASAVGKRSFRLDFAVSPWSGDQYLRIPPLVPDAPAHSSLLPPNDRVISSVPPPRANGKQRSWGLLAGGAGIALVGAGAFLGLRAFAFKHTAENQCNATFCTEEGLGAISDMRTAEAASTISALAGLAAFGAGVYLVLSDASHSPAKTGLDLRVDADVAVLGVRARLTF